MRLLFLTQVLPYPLDAGPKVRAYYVLRHLAERHDVTLASFVRPTDTLAATRHLAQYCTAVHTVPLRRSRPRDALHALRSLVTGESFIIARDWVPAMSHLLDAQCALHAFDAVHADQLWMAPYALAARSAGRTGNRPAAVLDQHNAVYLIPLRLAQRETSPLKRKLLELESHKLARYEVKTCRCFDRVVWVSQQDHDAVQRQAALSHSPPPVDRALVPCSAVIPICGDADTTSPIARKPGAHRLTFLGGLHWPPNEQGIRWFADRVWPLLSSAVPDCTLTVIGKAPPAQLAGPRIEVTGYVDDPTPFLEETAVFIVPLLAGGGMRVKIVDAWLWGLPVVSTTIGAEGITIRPGENVLIADSPEQFAAAVLALLQDPARGERLGNAGRKWAKQAYHWRTVYRHWDDVYRGLQL